MDGMPTSPFWVGGEIFLGLSLPIFVGPLIAACGDQISTGADKPLEALPRRLPNTGAFPLSVFDSPRLGHSRIVGQERLLTVRAERPTLAPRLGPAQVDNRKGLARAVTGRRAA
jgi:hypothetical protein